MKSSFKTQIPNTFGIEATAEQYVEYESVDELRALLPQLRGKRVMHVGGGSNLLFLTDFDGIVLHSLIDSFQIVGTSDEDGSVIVRAGSGMVWDDFVAETLRQGLYGAENLSLIPGEVGASAVQNIGAYGVEAKDIIDTVECIDLRTGEEKIFKNADCHYAYRNSIFKTLLRGTLAVTHVCFRLNRQFIPNTDYAGLHSLLPSSDITADIVRQTIIRVRREKLPDPAQWGNAGSFFVNPVVPRWQFEQLHTLYPTMPHYDTATGVKIPAGWLIELCGWKGRSLGKAATYSRQALVLINQGGATGNDIMALCQQIRSDVRSKFGITIMPEVNIVQPEPEMKVTLLGTGTSTGVPQIGCTCPTCTSTDPRDKRLRCSSLVEVEDPTASDGIRRILIDCGPDFRQQMLDRQFHRIDAIFITHEHYDHVGGLDDLRPFSVFGDVTVYAEQYTAEHLRQRIPYCFTPKEKRYPGVPSIDLEDITVHEPVQVGRVSIMPLRVMHGKMPIIGLRIGNFAYITDMKTMPDADVDMLQGVRKIIVNGLRHEPHPTHQTIDEAIEFVHRLGDPEAWLIHMSHHTPPHAEEELILPSHIHLGYDGQTLKL